MEHQETLIENLNKKIENMIAKDENRYQKKQHTRDRTQYNQPIRRKKISIVSTAEKLWVLTFFDK